MGKQIGSHVALLGLVLFAPWWLQLVGFAIAFFFIGGFLPLVWAFVADTLYSVATPGLWHMEYILTLSALALFLVIHLLKRRILFYDEDVV